MYGDSDINFNVINGVPNADVYVLSSTNLVLPLNQWTRVITNTFDGSGNVSFTITGAYDPANPQVFYSLQLP